VSTNATVVAESPLSGKTQVAPLRVFSTCPSSLTTPDDYITRVAAASRWSEAAGCTGILIYTDNTLVDPWLVSQIVIENTGSLCPLVAVQPVYMHPYSVAKMVTTLGCLYNRRVFLNMVAGGFKNDLIALNDTTPHDSRYQRLVEYVRIIQCLLEENGPVNFAGQFYQVRNLTLTPRLQLGLHPGFLMSGSSDAGRQAAHETGAIAVEYPEPPAKYDPGSQTHTDLRGIRIGILTRPREEDAWAIALERFPETRKGQLTRQMATKVSDSVWHHRLSEISGGGTEHETYWLRPFENYQSNCPYLVGSYENVTHELSRYVELGYRTLILDIPASAEDLEHIGIVLHGTVQRMRV
jgi:alkanesulfonate monooxygenase